MEYVNKTQSVLDELLNVIFYEEGRLAILDKYGKSLEESDKVRISQLVATQRENLGHLLEIYNGALGSNMRNVAAVGEELDSIMDKVISGFVVSTVPDVQVQEDIPVAKEGSVQDASQDLASNSQLETTVSSNTDTPVVGEASVQDASQELANNPQPEVTVASIIPVAPVVGGAPVQNSSQGLASNPQPEVTVATITDAPVASDASVQNVSQETASNSQAEASVVGNGGLQPIIEGNTNQSVQVVSSSETVSSSDGGKAVEENGSGDIMLSPITDDNVSGQVTGNSNNLVVENKEETLPQYTRVTNFPVKAILVGKEQYGNLQSSRAAQKTVMSSKQADDTGVHSVSPVSDLPVIETAGQITPSINEAVNVQGVQNDLQAMMEEANNLYKSGKTQEAQVLYNKVSALNKEIQEGKNPVLVKE